ncbi:MAG TPA: DNA-binding domain-containing protein [Casimicrobiaceae bacterium]
MRSLLEAQRRFAAALLAAPDTRTEFPSDRLAVYRNNLRSNYRSALSATYPVIERLVGGPFFDAAIDAYVIAHPSRSGDLNVYGDRFAEFLATYAPAAPLPYLADVARLEWAIDEVHRAAAVPRAPDAVLATFAIVRPERLASLRLRLDPSCRLVASPYPILRIWQVNQPEHDGTDRVALDEGADALLVRRDAHGTSIERLPAGVHAWLAALACDATLGAAIDAAQLADPSFDLGTALREQVAAGTIVAAIDA